MTEVAVERLGRNNEKRITDHGVRLIEQMAREGCSETTIAKRLRIDRTTLNVHKRQRPEIAEALERGYSAMEDELVDILMTRARDPAHKGGVTAAIFLLKARRGYEGTKTPSHLTINVDNRTQVALPAAKDMEAYRRRYLGEAADG